MKLSKNLVKGLIRTEMLKVNPDWKIRNKVIFVSEEGLKMIEQKKITEKELREAIRGMAEVYLHTKYDVWKDMHYTAGPFEDHYDLSCRAFKGSSEYPAIIYRIDLDDETTFFINNRAVNRYGSALKIWYPASNIGWYNFDR